MGLIRVNVRYKDFYRVFFMKVKESRYNPSYISKNFYTIEIYLYESFIIYKYQRFLLDNGIIEGKAGERLMEFVDQRATQDTAALIN